MCAKPRPAYSMAVAHQAGSTKPARRSSAGLGCPPAIQIGADRCPAGPTSVSTYDPRTRLYVTRHWRAPAGTSPVNRTVPGGSNDAAPDAPPGASPDAAPGAFPDAAPGGSPDASPDGAPGAVVNVGKK